MTDEQLELTDEDCWRYFAECCESHLRGLLIGVGIEPDEAAMAAARAGRQIRLSLERDARNLKMGSPAEWIRKEAGGKRNGHE